MRSATIWCGLQFLSLTNFDTGFILIDLLIYKLCLLWKWWILRNIFMYYKAVVSQFPSDHTIPCAPCYPAVAWQNKAFWYLKMKQMDFINRLNLKLPQAQYIPKRRKQQNAEAQKNIWAKFFADKKRSQLV